VNGGCSVYGCESAAAASAEASQASLEKMIKDESGFLAYAGFWRRFAAVAVDGFLMNLVLWPIALVLLIAGNQVLAGGVSQLLAIALWVPYATYFIGSQGATIGKKCMRVQVIPVSRAVSMTYGRAFVRYIGNLISALSLMLGYLWMVWDGNRQTFHDKIAKTYVVYDRRDPSVTGRGWAIVIGTLIVNVILNVIYAAVAQR